MNRRLLASLVRKPRTTGTRRGVPNASKSESAWHGNARAKILRSGFGPSCARSCRRGRLDFSDGSDTATAAASGLP